MAYRRKTWAEKMKPGAVYKLERADKAFADIPAGSTMLIATPQIVDQYLRNIPKGVHTSLQQMRKDLAAEYGADYTCPVTSGIFLRIAAENAWEEHLKGKAVSRIAPFWRMIDSRSPAAKKLSFGMELLKKQRKSEDLPE